MLGKFKEVIDTTVLANGDSVASYLVASGTLLTSTTNGAKQSLDTLPASNFTTNFTATGTDYGSLTMGLRRDANTTIASADGNMAPLQLDSAGALKVSGTLTATFTAEHNEDDPFTNGDSGIATLLVRQDTLAASTSTDGDYGSFKSNNLGELYVFDTTTHSSLTTANSSLSTIATNTGTTATNTGTISSTLTALSKAEDAAHTSGDQGIQALAVRKDAQGSNVNADGDYASLLVWSDGSLKVNDISNAACLQQQVAVANTATALPTSALVNRRTLTVQNAGTKSIWIGSATVTTTGATTGLEVPKGGFVDLRAGPACVIYGICASGTVNANILEM